MNNQARWLQKSECESYRHMTSHDVLNSRADAQGDVICSLRDNIRRLLTENEELCDLCCFLDDDRQQYRRDATEWQKLHQQMATEINQKVFRLAMTACSGLPKHRKSPQNTANHSKSPQIRPQITAIHRKSGLSDFKDVATHRKSV